MIIVDDDPLIRDALRLALADEFDIYLAETRIQAINLLREMPALPQLALVDLGLPPTPHRPEEGFRLLAELLAHSPHIKILVLSGQDELANARHARALGAIDFIAKPCLPEKIRAQLRNALLIQRTEQEQEHAEGALLGIVGQSPPVQAMRHQIMLYAATPFPVLIEGESGTGKELVAAALQRLGANSKAPYLVFNCAAISPSLLESALFGHIKGAFTGAHSAQAGFFEDAQDGTLLLDEIGEMPLELQAKLLRVLENGEYQRVGETGMRKSRARIIAATNRDLRLEVRSGNFRTDLYHRLSVFTIHVPPLREMGTDKLLLLNHFCDFYAAQSGNPPFALDTATMQLWERYAFPGNTRELRNIVIRLATKYPGQTVSTAQLEAELDPQQFTADTPGSDHGQRELALHTLQQQPGFSLDKLLLEQESHYIDAALELAQGNVSEAARLLGLQRTTLYSRMETLQKHKSSQSANNTIGEAH
ncbi:MAG: sigma-54-dependent Fis family transcriptional regulator [Betaproteobacteria bacterium]|nr:sigma-54-dependent Fis family transcriptional regulator [Betaproteobacteria bacterium]